MKRVNTDRVKAQCWELLGRIRDMERCAGWHRYADGRVFRIEDCKPHPDDTFNSGQYTASVKRASMDLTRTLAEMRKS